MNRARPFRYTFQYTFTPPNRVPRPFTRIVYPQISIMKPTADDDKRRNVFLAAASAGNQDIVEFLVKQHSRLCAESDSEYDVLEVVDTAIQVAAKHGHLDIVRHLIYHDMSTTLSRVRERVLNPFEYASEKGHIDVVQFLLQFASSCLLVELACAVDIADINYNTLLLSEIVSSV